MSCETHSEKCLLRDILAQSLHTKKPIMLGSLAHEHGVSELAIAEALPDDIRVFVNVAHFDVIWERLTSWPSANFIMQNLGSVLEVRTKIPSGTYGHGYFNLMGDFPLGGHLKMDDLSAICLLSLPFMGLESLSVQFFNTDGAVKFGIYGGRDAQRQIFPEVKTSFAKMCQLAEKGEQ